MVSQDVKQVHKGINMKPAMAKVYNEMDMSFILDVQSEAYRFFRGWQDLYKCGNVVDFVAGKSYTEHMYRTTISHTHVTL